MFKHALLSPKIEGKLSVKYLLKNYECTLKLRHIVINSNDAKIITCWYIKYSRPQNFATMDLVRPIEFVDLINREEFFICFYLF